MINVSDNLKVLINYNFSIDDIDILMNLYRPVIGIDAIKVYLCLIYANRECFILSELLKDNDLDSYEFNRYKQALEEVGLVTSFESINNNESVKYILNLLKPNSIKVLSNNLFVTKLKERTDKKTFEDLWHKYSADKEVPEGYKEVSSLNLVLNDRKNIELNNYQKKQPYVNHSVVYDIKNILSDNNIRNSSLYPALTTEEAIIKITKIMEIAGISPETFRSKVLISFIGDDTIDYDRLKLACFNCKETMNYDTHKGYLNPCSVFLKKMYGFEPDFFDKKLADSIYLKYEFPIDVINYILEYCFNNNDKKLNSNYVSRVCSTVKTKNIKTLKQIKEHLNVKKGVEFKRIEESEHQNIIIDKEAINAELNDILSKR